MRLKQFFTPVKSFNVDEAKNFITNTPLKNLRSWMYGNPQNINPDILPVQN